MKAKADIKALADSCLRLFGAASRSRAALLEDAAEGFEWTSHVLLRNLAALGPMRASDVAGCLHLDPSTVSRQVAGLVRDGLLERRSDPNDGRASILVPTEAGSAVIAEQDARRVAYFADMLSSWDRDEIATFRTLLARFTDDYSAAHEAWMTSRGHSRGDRKTLTGDNA